jgi:hypothetical protein
MVMPKSLLCLVSWLLVGGALFNAPSARAECTASTIERMADRGKTVAAIARICEMSQQDVKDIVDPPDDSSGGNEPGNSGTGTGPATRGLLPRGTPVGQCGCWGPADPNARVPHAQCESGSAQPRSCGVPCAAGGVAWQGVCS